MQKIKMASHFVLSMGDREKEIIKVDLKSRWRGLKAFLAKSGQQLGAFVDPEAAKEALPIRTEAVKTI